MKKFGVKLYSSPLKLKTAFRCKLCGRVFECYQRPSRSNRNIYCSPECSKEAKRKVFNEESFRVNLYRFNAPVKNVGDYSNLAIGKRQKSFVNRDKLDHFFFRQGIYDEGTAYLFGVLITDGNLYRDKKGTFSVRLQLTDHDIVEKISALLRNRNPLYADSQRRTCTLLLTSPYLFHDLSALGCVPKKTTLATYPLVPGKMDRHLIRGIIDGDGSWVIRKKDGLLSLQICGNDLLMFGVYKSIINHLKISPQSVQYPSTYNSRIKMRSFCHMRYNTTDSVKIRDWIYDSASIYGERKYRRAHSANVPYTSRLTTAKLATFLGVAPDFVKKVARQNVLPHRKVGHYYYFEQEDVPLWTEFLKTRLIDPKCKFPNRHELIEKWLNVT
ncbi:MAG: helix-turn-helix domain-containing protein [Acidobacteria bacterium]|nr:helix-turn-helix domain-containing protein [Acidobacteriota bacterium]